MNAELIRQHIRSIHKHIHRLRQSGSPRRFHAELLQLCEENLVDLNFARQELKRIEALRLPEPLENLEKEES